MKKAFSLLELLISVALLGLLSLALLGLFLTAVRLGNKNREATRCARVAQLLLEGLRDPNLKFPATEQVFDGAIAAPTVAGFPPQPYPRYTQEGQDYVLKVHVRPVPGEADLYSVEVGVSWQDGSHPVRLESYFSRD